MSHSSKNISLSGTFNMIDFNPISAPSHVPGRLYYDSATDALTFYNSESDVALQIGEENWTFVRNDTGATITNGNIVYISGSSGGVPQITKAQADVDGTSEVIGVVTHDIGIGETGYITTFGLVRGLNTSLLAAGSEIYLSATTPGGATTTKPISPNYVVRIGYVAVQDVANGTFLVCIENFGDKTDVSGLADTDSVAFAGLTLDPGASGDSFVQFDINTTGEFRIGVDDDDADKFKVSVGSALGTNDTLTVDANGAILKPLQPCFLVRPNGSKNNVTGDGTIYTIVFDDEVFDQGSDFDGTSTFTAPVTGKYLFNSGHHASNVVVGMTDMKFRILTSNHTYMFHQNNPESGNYVSSGSIIVDMDAADTAIIDIQYSGGSKVVDIIDDANGGTFFSGSLLT